MTTIAGVAGSLLIILLWIFILNLIILFGAEISKVYASTFGPHPHQHSRRAIENIVNSFLMSIEGKEKRTKNKISQIQGKTDEKKNEDDGDKT